MDVIDDKLIHDVHNDVYNVNLCISNLEILSVIGLFECRLYNVYF